MWDTKYDQAMVAFLDCLQQFQEEIEKDNSDFCLPYRYKIKWKFFNKVFLLNILYIFLFLNRIKNGKIEDQTKHLYSIKYAFFFVCKVCIITPIVCETNCCCSEVFIRLRM